MSREELVAALYTLLLSSGAYRTVGRRLKLWSEVHPQEQPALYVRHVKDHFPHRGTGLPPRVTMECEAWLYANVNVDGVLDGIPDTAMNTLLDGIDAALKPPPGQQTQTLGGRVVHCWIEGTIDIHPGDIDGQALAVVPIMLLVPTIF